MAITKRTDVTCEDVESLSDAFVHRALSPSLHAAFASHIKQCGRCGHIIGRYRDDFYRRITIFNQGLDCEDDAWPDLTGWSPRVETAPGLVAGSGSRGPFRCR